jgi:hypothetical protein
MLRNWWTTATGGKLTDWIPILRKGAILCALEAAVVVFLALGGPISRPDYTAYVVLAIVVLFMLFPLPESGVKRTVRVRKEAAIPARKADRPHTARVHFW